MLGVILIDKPLHISSHDVVNRARKIFQTRRIGHAGTLDPLASGALVLAVGPATRFLQYLPLEPKTYSFSIKFGEETTTQDAEGEVIASLPTPADLAHQIEAHLPGFRGEIDQIPPMYSAVKKGGKPLYALAREGKEIEREPRTVFIHDLKCDNVQGVVADLTCVCSGGTYIRTLGHDLGQRIGCGAHVVQLRRTRVGHFGVGQAITLEELSMDHLIPLHEALSNLPCLQLLPDEAEAVWHGQAIQRRDAPEGRFVTLLSPSGEVMSMATPSGPGTLQPVCVIPPDLLT